MSKIKIPLRPQSDLKFPHVVSKAASKKGFETTRVKALKEENMERLSGMLFKTHENNMLMKAKMKGYVRVDIILEEESNNSRVRYR